MAVLVLAGCGGGGEQVDIVLVEGSVYTLEWPAPLPQDQRPSPASSWTEAHGWRPAAQALVIDAGQVVWVGSDADAQLWRERAKNVIELDGAAVLPGLLDGGATDFFQRLQRIVSAPTGAAIENAVRTVLSEARGTIAPGSLANLTVVRPDPFRTAPELLIPEGSLLFTVRDGRVVQSAGAH
jgi:hypothetical protein